MDTLSSVVGAILWSLLTALPLLYLSVTVFRFTRWPRKPAICQPIQGSRAVQGKSPTLLFPILVHVLSLVGVALSFVLRPWADAQGKLDHPNGAAENIVDKGSEATILTYLILWILLGLFQLFLMIGSSSGEGFLRWWTHWPVMMLPKLWAGQGLFLALIWSVMLMVGLVLCVCAGANPKLGFYMLIIAAFFAALQQFLLKRYIEAMPGPLPGGTPGHPQSLPIPGVAAHAIAWVAAPGPGGSPQGYPVYAVEAFRVPVSSEPQLDPEFVLPPRQLPPSQFPPSQVSAYVHPVPAVMQVRPNNELELQQRNFLPSIAESHNDG